MSMRYARLLPAVTLVAASAVTGLLLAKPIDEQPPTPRGYICYKAKTTPTIDGKIDDDCWSAAPWSDDFVDIEGDKKPKPRFRTRMKMLWDDQTLYIAAELEEPHIWATYKKHDSVIFHEPDFEVFLDPDGDNHHYGELELNALNTTWDLLLTKPYRYAGRALNGWEILGLKSAVHIDGTINNSADVDKRWTVEIAWPFEGLKEISSAKFPPADSDQWRINFSRVEWDIDIKNGRYEKVKGRPEHNWVWSPQGVIDMHRPERWGFVQFTTKNAGSVVYRLDPAQEVRVLLHQLLEAQRAHHEKNKAFARTLADLGFKNQRLGTPTMMLTPAGFELTLQAPATHGGKHWGLSHDARLWNR